MLVADFYQVMLASASKMSKLQSLSAGDKGESGDAAYIAPAAIT